MKKIIFSVILLASVASFIACEKDNEDKWVGGGDNLVVGTWVRDREVPVVKAIFKEDFTSGFQKFDSEGNPTIFLPQGEYRVKGDSLLEYKTGFINKIRIDADSLWITYGYNASKQTTKKYIRVTEEN